MNTFNFLSSPVKTIVFLLTTAAAFSSCSKDRLTASGDKKTEERELRNFSGIESDGSTDVHLSYGTSYKVTVMGSDNLLPYFKTEVRGGVLKMGYERVNVKRDDIQVYVTLPAVNYIAISGSGDVDLSGTFGPSDDLEISISGSGEVEAENIFNVKRTKIRISGSGEADLKRLVTEQADIDISGSGDARIGVSGLLKARISGSGKVYYSGSPQVDAQVSGSGKVIKI